MKIDPVKKTITFEEGVTVTSDQLRWLLSIVDGPAAGSGFPVEISVPKTPRPPDWVTLRKITTSVSRSGNGHEYVQVLVSDGSYACSCNDWVYRKSNQRGVHSWCKHIHTAISLGRL